MLYEALYHHMGSSEDEELGAKSKSYAYLTKSNEYDFSNKLP